MPTITLDLDPFFAAAANGPLSFFITLFREGGWIVFVVFFFFFFFKGLIIWWLSSRQSKYVAKWEYVFLAIDVPRFNEQGPKAVEHIFSVLAGTHSTANFKEKWWIGKVQEWFSFEIVSIHGYVQFLVRTPKHFRDLIETAIYSQYRDALITEIEDYTTTAPTSFPDEEYDIWGTELVLAKDQAYPIRTYEVFSDIFQELSSKKFKDPMASTMEVLTRIGDGEQIWFQIILIPTGDDWKEGSKKVVRKLLGRKEIKKKTFLIGEMAEFAKEFFHQVSGSLWLTQKATDAVKADLSPYEREIVECVEKKASKIGFVSTLRFIYISKRAQMRKPLAVNGFIGSIKQFNTVHLNAFKPRSSTATKAGYFAHRIVPGKQSRIMNNYKGRAPSAMPFILNIEELATIFHFPSAEVRNPMVRTADLKRVPAPIILPVEEEKEEFYVEELRLPHESKQIGEEVEKESPKHIEELSESEEDSYKNGIEPPPNLPIA